MKFLIVWALVILSALNIWAEETTQTAISEEADETTQTAISEEVTAKSKGKCSFSCALKTLLFDDDDFGKDMLSLLTVYDDPSAVEKTIKACNEQSSADTEEGCDNYFDCIEAGLKNNNVTFLFDLKN